MRSAPISEFVTCSKAVTSTDVRWYLAYGLSLRDLKEMMAERGISIDHSTIHRWVVHLSPVLLKRFNCRKRAVGGKWHLDETYIKVRGQWMYLYRAIDSAGDTVEFWLNERRDLPAAKRFMRKALARHGRPDRIVIDGSQTNREAIVSCDAENRLRDRSLRVLKAIRIRSSRYLNNRMEQDHRRIKRRVRPMLGPIVRALQTLRGVDLIVAVTFVTEVGDVSRFESPRQLMGYLGLVPGERSSGETIRRGGITKAGNSRVRHMLVESAWSYRHPPRVGAQKLYRLEQAPPKVRETAWKAQSRLTARYRMLSGRGKRQTVVCTAIARELAGFMWAVASAAHAS